jgi:hypothetical protein
MAIRKLLSQSMSVEIEENGKNLNHDSQYLGLDSKKTPPKYRSEALAFLSTCSVMFLILVTIKLKHGVLCNKGF